MNNNNKHGNAVVEMDPQFIQAENLVPQPAVTSFTLQAGDVVTVSIAHAGETDQLIGGNRLPGGGVIDPPVFNQPVTISGFLPASGSVDTVLRIFGANLLNPLGVTVGERSAAIIFQSNSEIRVLVPYFAKTGKIKVFKNSNGCRKRCEFYCRQLIKYRLNSKKQS